MLGHRRMPAISAATHVHRDAFAAEKDLDGARGEAGLDLAAGEAMRHRVMVVIDGDMVVEPDPAALPLGMDPRLRRQRLELGCVDPLEQLAAGATDRDKEQRQTVVEENNDDK